MNSSGVCEKPYNMKEIIVLSYDLYLLFSNVLIITAVNLVLGLNYKR